LPQLSSATAKQRRCSAPAASSWAGPFGRRKWTLDPLMVRFIGALAGGARRACWAAESSLSWPAIRPGEDAALGKIAPRQRGH